MRLIGLRSLSRGVRRCTLEPRVASYTRYRTHYQYPAVLGLEPCYQIENTRRGITFSHCLYQSDHIVKVPAFAESVSEGDVRWEKAVGDRVNVDDVVCEIETDKTALPIPAPANGVIAELFVENGGTVKTGMQLFRLTLAEGASVGEKSAQPSPTAPPPPQAAPPPPPRPPAASAGGVQEAPKADVVPPPSPAPTKPLEPTSSIPTDTVRPQQAAREAGPGGPFLKLPPVDPTKEISGTRTEARVKMNRMRQRIALRLKEAQNVNAMLTTFNEVDLTNLIQLRKQHQDEFFKKYGIKLGFMSAFCKAAAYALLDQPVLNAVIDGNEIVYRDYVDISVAVATPKGLVVPVLRNVESMNYADIERGIAALGEKAKKNILAVEDMEGGTFTVSNGGVFGSLFATPIINPPQSAILGMYAIKERPIVVGGKVEARPMMYVALTYDHRLIDGREATLFLVKVKQAVEDPRAMLLGL